MVTNKEAIKIIENLPIVRYEAIKNQKSDLGTALRMAIEALEKQIHQTSLRKNDNLISNEPVVEDITLLTIEETEQLPVRVREFYDWWWLRSPGVVSFTATGVSIGGYVYGSGLSVYIDDSVVRPALIIPNLKSSNLINGDFNPYDEVEFKGIKWVTISDTMLLCNDKSFGYHMFDEESNDYEKSEINQYIHEKAREFGIL